MSDEIDDGGSAFPHPTINDFYQRSGGMSLRDWFAGQALAGVTACVEHVTSDREIEKNQAYDDLAEHVYLMADAMLRARKKTP